MFVLKFNIVLYFCCLVMICLCETLIPYLEVQFHVVGILILIALSVDVCEPAVDGQ